MHVYSSDTDYCNGTQFHEILTFVSLQKRCQIMLRCHKAQLYSLIYLTMKKHQALISYCTIPYNTIYSLDTVPISRSGEHSSGSSQSFLE